MQKIPQSEWKKFQSNFCQTWTWKIIKLNWIWVWIWIINTEPRSEMCWRFCKIFCESLPISINPCYQCWSSELSFNPQLSCLWLMEEDCAVWLTDMWPMVGPTADWGESSRKSPLYSELTQHSAQTCERWAVYPSSTERPGGTGAVLSSHHNIQAATLIYLDN